MDVEREWLDLTASLLAAPLTALPERHLAAALMATFDAPACAFHARPGPDTVVQRIYPEGLFDAARLAEWARLAVESPGCHPLLAYYLRTGDQGPQQVADVVPALPGRARGRWVELARCHGYEHQLAIPLPGGAPSNRAPSNRAPSNHALPVGPTSSDSEGPRWFVLGRGTPFGADRMALARRVQRLIVGLDRQAAALRRWQARTPGADVADVALTPRELSVLTLVADGLTAAATARRLVVAERTVHKHLERAYAKLGVSDRVSAVVRAQRLGLLPAPALAVAR